MDGPIDNEAFYAGRATPRDEAVDEDRFYAAPGRPPAAPSPLATLAARPVHFGTILFVLGWLGIAFQRGIFHQIVAGAPLFEEPAKVGGAIVLVALLGLRSPLLRLPIAALFGAGFGVMEHFLTYAEEDVLGLAVRIAFHGLSAAASMAAWSALEPDPDARLRWAATIPSTLLHYANNFVALVLGLSSVLLPWLSTLATAWSIAVTVILGATLVLIALRPEPFRAGVGSILRRLIPAMRPSS